MLLQKEIYARRNCSKTKTRKHFQDPEFTSLYIPLSVATLVYSYRSFCLCVCMHVYFIKMKLSWKIPWMEEPGGLQSMGSLRVGHDWATLLSLSTFMHWRRKWQPTPVFLPGESQGRGSVVGCRVWGRTESDTTERLSSSSSSSSNSPVQRIDNQLFFYGYINDVYLSWLINFHFT